MVGQTGVREREVAHRPTLRTGGLPARAVFGSTAQVSMCRLFATCRARASPSTSCGRETGGLAWKVSSIRSQHDVHGVVGDASDSLRGPAGTRPAGVRQVVPVPWDDVPP